MTIDGNFIDEKDGYIFNDGGQRVYLAEDSGAKEDAINFLLDKPVSERFLYEKSGLDFIQKLIAKDDCTECDEKTGQVKVIDRLKISMIDEKNNVVDTTPFEIKEEDILSGVVDVAKEGHVNKKLSDGEIIELNGECINCGENPLIPDVAKPKENTPTNDNLIPSPSDNLPADTKNEFAFLGLIALAFLAFLGFNVKG